MTQPFHTLFNFTQCNLLDYKYTRAALFIDHITKQLHIPAKFSPPVSLSLGHHLVYQLLPVDLH
jgi:hypothetical protein